MGSLILPFLGSSQGVRVKKGYPGKDHIRLQHSHRLFGRGKFIQIIHLGKGCFLVIRDFIIQAGSGYQMIFQAQGQHSLHASLIYGHYFLRRIFIDGGIFLSVRSIAGNGQRVLCPFGAFCFRLFCLGTGSILCGLIILYHTLRTDPSAVTAVVSAVAACTGSHTYGHSCGKDHCQHFLCYCFVLHFLYAPFNMPKL